MTCRDQFGVPLTVNDPDALRHYDDAVAKLLTFSGDPVAEVDAATAGDPSLVMGHVLKGLLCVLGTEKSLLPNARAALEAGMQVAGDATEREARHLAALECWIDGRLHDACSTWETILVDQPDDALAMLAAHQGDFFLGHSTELRDRVARRLGSIDRGSRLEGYYLGMHAFGLEETGDYAAAELAGRLAVERDRRSTWRGRGESHRPERCGRRPPGPSSCAGRRATWTSRASLQGRIHGVPAQLDGPGGRSVRPRRQALFACAATCASRSSRLRILPTLVFGSSSRNSMNFGFL
jgi:hypothetical protein